MISAYWVLIFQIALMWSVFIWYFRILDRRMGRAPIQDLGIIWPLVLLLYSTMPVITWLGNGGRYPIVFGRLALLDPDVDTHIEILNIAIAYLLSFIFCNYIFLNKVLIKKLESPPVIPLRHLKIAIFLYSIGLLFELSLKLTGVIRVSSDYADSYLAVAQLPTVIGQFYKLSKAVGNISAVILVIGVLQRYHKYKWVLYIYLLILISSYNVAGHRSDVAAGLFLVFICWHVIVRPFSIKVLLVAGVGGLFVFNALGFYRGLLEGADTQLGLSVSEFLMVYGNAIEMAQRMKSEYINLPLDIRFAEFISFLPSQILGSEKNSLDTWFVDTYHNTYFNSGGGLAFGALPQAIIGAGAFEAIIRGGILGILFAIFANNTRRRNYLWWLFPVQIFLVVYMYYSIRSSTFSFIGAVFQVIVPSLVIISILAKMFFVRSREAAFRGIKFG